MLYRTIGFLFAIVGPVFSCSVCGGGGSPQTQNAYLVATISLSLLPMILAGIGFLVIRNYFSKDPKK
ncbi:MAG: hypothetical protein ACI9BD_000744 [Candidatus Marinamargulisbacteria bacterium]|jgi:hypothetical protein